MNISFSKAIRDSLVGTMLRRTGLILDWTPDNIFLKRLEHGKFAWLLKQFGATTL